MITPAFCTTSFLVICWLLSVYLAFHIGAALNERQWMRESRRRLKCLYDSPWLRP